MTHGEIVAKLRCSIYRIEEINSEISGSRHMELADALAEAKALLKLLEPGKPFWRKEGR